MLKKYKFPIIMFSVFEAIAISLWLSSDNVFYLFNFTYIGGFIAFGQILFIRNYKYARQAVQLGVGLYMLAFLGLIAKENMNIEGFWYFLFLGVFQAAVIHYVVAKIFGPFIFGRGWCGYACWTAMVLDFLPYKVPQAPRKDGIQFIRYIVFVLSLVFTGSLFLLKIPNLGELMYWSFIIGNLLYYAVGISLAFILKDNRAFCKYICPITVFLKPASYYSLIRIKVDQDKCVSCNICKKICPMNVDITDNRRRRKNGTECILCNECIRHCPKGAIRL